MRGLGFVLKAVLAVSTMLALFAIVGGLDWLVEQKMLSDEQAEASAAATPGVAALEPAVQAPPVLSAPPSQPSLAQAAALPSADAVTGGGIAPFNQTLEDIGADAQSGQDMIRFAAATPQIPALTLGHIPALVAKFAPAKVLFGAVNAPSRMAARSIGFYSRGCLAGARPLPVNGSAWQAMRLSRNRIWGHPSLVRYIQRFARDAKAKDGWPGLLIGDMSMPRGGPMPFGHASHQVGLDVDIWYRPMPDRMFSAEERESTPMETFLLDPAHVNPQMWTPDNARLLRRAVSYPEVARVFVNPAIKKWLCDNEKEDRAFLRKISPIMGHDEHFHVRLVCPADNRSCRNQPMLATDEGCGKGLDAWVAKLSKAALAPVPVAAPAPSPKAGTTPLRATRGKRSLTLAQLPPDCRTVLQAPSMSAAR